MAALKSCLISSSILSTSHLRHLPICRSPKFFKPLIHLHQQSQPRHTGLSSRLDFRTMTTAPESVTPSSFQLPSDLPPLPSILDTEPARCVLDAFRIAIAKLVSESLPSLTVEQVYAGVDYGKKGVDFTIALPRFRLPGKIDELAGKVLAKVRLFPSLLLRPPSYRMQHDCMFPAIPRLWYGVRVTLFTIGCVELSMTLAHVDLFFLVPT